MCCRVPASLPTIFLAGAVFLLLVLLVATPAQAATYYVDGACPISGDGTSLACATVPGGSGAFNTLDAGISALRDCMSPGPCDMLSIRGQHSHIAGQYGADDPGHANFTGEYHRSYPFSVAATGFCDSGCQINGWTPNNTGQILIQGYDTETAIIDGLLQATDWTETAPGSGIWYRSVEARTGTGYCAAHDNAQQVVRFVYERIPGDTCNISGCNPGSTSNPCHCATNTAMICKVNSDCGGFGPLPPNDNLGCTAVEEGEWCEDEDAVYANPHGTFNPNIKTGVILGIPDTQCLLQNGDSNVPPLQYVTFKNIMLRSARQYLSFMRNSRGIAFDSVVWLGGHMSILQTRLFDIDIRNSLLIYNVRGERIRHCSGGSNSGRQCSAADDCPGGTCSVFMPGGGYAFRGGGPTRWTTTNTTIKHAGQGYLSLPPWDSIPFMYRGGQINFIETGWDASDPPGCKSGVLKAGASEVACRNRILFDGLKMFDIFGGAIAGEGQSAVEVRNSEFIRTLGMSPTGGAKNVETYEWSIHNNLFQEVIDHAIQLRGICADNSHNNNACIGNEDCEAKGVCSNNAALACIQDADCGTGTCNFIGSDMCASDADCTADPYVRCGGDGRCHQQCVGIHPTAGDFGVRIYNNRFVRNGQSWSFPARGVLDIQGGPLSRVEIFNNVFYGDSAYGGKTNMFDITGPVDGLIFKNNIFAGNTASAINDYAMRVNGRMCANSESSFCTSDADCPKGSCNGGRCNGSRWITCSTSADCPNLRCVPSATTGNLHIDNNIYYDINGGSSSKVIHWDGTDYGTAAALCSAVSQECNGIDATAINPLFADASNNDFHLASDGIAKDAVAASNVPTFFSTDFEQDFRPQGSAWDIGADEYVPSAGCSPGDVNCDGTAGDSSDIQLVVNVRLGLVTDQAVIQRADLNSDTKVDAADIQAIVNMRLGV